MARDHISHARVTPTALGFCQPWDSHVPRVRRAPGRHHTHFSPHLWAANNDNWPWTSSG